MINQLAATSAARIPSSTLKKDSAGTRSAKAAYRVLTMASSRLWMMYMTGRYSMPNRLKNNASAVPWPTAMPALTIMKKKRKYSTFPVSPSWTRNSLPRRVTIRLLCRGHEFPGISHADTLTPVCPSVSSCGS